MENFDNSRAWLCGPCAIEISRYISNSLATRKFDPWNSRNQWFGYYLLEEWRVPLTHWEDNKMVNFKRKPYQWPIRYIIHTKYFVFHWLLQTTEIKFFFLQKFRMNNLYDPIFMPTNLIRHKIYTLNQNSYEFCDV